MTLQELKNKILDNSLSVDKLIFKYDNDTFLVDSYIKRIAKQNNYNILMIERVSDIYDIESNVFESHENNLYILECDSLDIDLNKFDVHRLIVKTKKAIAENNDIIITFDKLLDWQIEDYVRVMLPGLDEAQILWLCDIANHDIHRLDLECKKINIFEKSEQKSIFNELNEDNMYEDLNSLTIFNFSNAIIRNDKKLAKEILEQIKNIDIEPVGLVTVLYKNFKNIINIQMNRNSNAADLKMSPKQFAAIKRNCNVYNNDKLIEIFNMLTSIDYKLKSGLIDNDKIIDYLVINIM